MQQNKTKQNSNSTHIQTENNNVQPAGADLKRQKQK